MKNIGNKTMRSSIVSAAAVGMTGVLAPAYAYPHCDDAFIQCGGDPQWYVCGSSTTNVCKEMNCVNMTSICVPC
jgi:hypothetical protein